MMQEEEEDEEVGGVCCICGEVTLGWLDFYIYCKKVYKCSFTDVTKPYTCSLQLSSKIIQD